MPAPGRLERMIGKNDCKKRGQSHKKVEREKMGESKKGSNGFNVGMLIFAILVGAFIIMMHYPEVINGMIGSATIGS